MRCQLRQFITAAAVYSLSWQLSARAQVNIPAAMAEAGTSDACSSNPSSDHKEISADQITVADLTFIGDMQMPVEDRNKLSSSIQQQTFSGDVDGVKDEILERVRRAWQDHGYFNVHAKGDANVLSSTPVSQQIAVTVWLEEGMQYRLNKITFSGNNEISNLRALRSQFPIQDGEIFNRAGISRGLENLRFAYLQLGHLNFTSIPNTEFNEELQTISLNISLSEGMKFFVSKIDFLGLDKLASQDLLEKYPLSPGNVYDQRLVDLALEAHAPSQTAGPPPESRVHMQLDERAGSVAIRLDFRTCPIE